MCGRYGNCFKTKLFGETQVFTSSTESAKAILNNEGGKFSKRYIKSIAELLGPDSLLCAGPQQHKLIRGRLLSLFSIDSLSSFVKMFDALVLEAMSNWPCGPTVVIQDEALKVCYVARIKVKKQSKRAIILFYFLLIIDLNRKFVCDRTVNVCNAASL